MIDIIFLIVLLFCLNKWFYHTVIVLAIWWQVLQNLRLFSYSFTGVCVILMGAFLFNRFSKGEIKWKEIPLRKPFVVLFICYVISLLNGEIRPISIIHIFSLFIIPISTFFSIKKIGNFWNFLFTNIILYAIVILSVGFVELYLGFNPVILWLKAIGIGDYTAEQSEEYIRFGMYRCQSLLVWCSTYGVTCGFTAVLLLLLNYFGRIKSTKIVIFIVALLFFGMFTCGTRSVYVAVGICLLAYVFLAAIKVKYIVAVLIFSIFAYYIFTDFFDQVLLSFTDSSSVGGSDAEMRAGQFDVAYSEFIKSPLIGNGEGRCGALLEKNIGLLGAESFLFWVLIDRGIMGLICSFYLLISTIGYVKKQNISLCFIPLGIMTGKFISLFPQIDETYYFFYLFILLRAYREYSVKYK